MKIKKKMILMFFLFIISCDNPLKQNEELHCIVDYNGFYDVCGICSGGSSGHIANAELDCTGYDEDGNIIDENLETACFGEAFFDGCGVCSGDGTSCEEPCNYTDLGCDNICNSGFVNDECGICNGDNLDKDLCGICFGDNNSCDAGLLTLSKWNFSEIHFWNNSECIGFPYSSFFNMVCIEDMCYDYEIDFYFNIDNGSYSFSQINKTWSINTPLEVDENTINGIWYFENSALCLDYDNLELEDNCYENIEFENTFFDCETNLDNCINNAVNFSNMNAIEDMCSLEKYVNSNNQSTNNNSNNFPISNSSTIFKNLLISFHKYFN